MGNPIAVIGGNKFQVSIDFPERALFPPLIRYYNSSPLVRPGSFGAKWRSSYDVSLAFYPNSSDPNYIALEEADGRVLYFRQQTDSVWVSNPDISMRLTKKADIWEIGHRSDLRRYTFDAQGRLLRISEPSKGARTVTYDQSGDIESVSNELGQTITFLTNAQGRVTRASGRGSTIVFGYDDSGRLRTVTVDGRLHEQYAYEDTDFPAALTGVLSGDGTRISTWAYDESGRAVSWRQGDVEKISIEYLSADATRVTNALGKQTTYHFDSVAGVKKLVSVEGHPAPGCAAANKNYTYTANGRIASRTDWKGNTTTYDYNDRGLVIRKVEAAGTPEERVTTTTWHAEYRLPDVLTKPERTIDHDYDDQGRLILRDVRETN